MPRLIALVAVLLACASSAAAQEKELVATIKAPVLAGGIVSELAWDGGTLLIQTVAMERNGQLAARYFIAPGSGMELRRAPAPPLAMDRYWKMKASRISPTGLGKITLRHDAKLPLYGVGSQERRMLDAVDMGGTRVTHDLRLHDLILHQREQSEPPYDGEVWSWSPAELNRIAYVDGKGDLWIARADGTRAERLLRGRFTLPAWSDDGRILAVAERKDDGREWDVSVIHLPERFRK